MASQRKPSHQTMLVLEALLGEPTSWRYGYEVSTETGLASGSLYPILARLEERGLLESEWEDEAPLGRPRRHHFRLTESGVQFAVENRATRATTTATRPAWGPA